MRHLLAWAALVTFATTAAAQPTASRITSAADRALMTELVEREDSRAPYDGADARRRGLVSANPFIRAFTVRGLGRLEQVAAGAAIMPSLADPAAEVRVAAADALAQSVARPLPAGASADARALGGQAVDRARTALAARLAAERAPEVRAALVESLGRLPQGSVTQVKATASLIAPSLEATSVIERRGAIRGIFFLARKREARAAGVIPTVVTDRLYAMLGDATAGYTPTDRYNIAFALLGAVALDDDRSAVMIADSSPYVRDRAVAALSRSSDLAVIRGLLGRALVDPAPVVRFRAVGVYAQKLRASDGCGGLVELTRDTNMNVALGATDALSGCRGDSTVARYLETLARRLADDDRWHLPAHAFVSLAAVDPARAGALMPRYTSAANFFVRMYADTAARLMGDAATLYAMSRDAHPNVQASAIEGLSRIVAHAADSVYLRALQSDDNQVLMAAAAALKGSTMPGLPDAVAARWRARVARGWDTDVDGNTAMAELITSLGGSVAPPVHERVKLQLPTFGDLAALETVTARIEMADGSVVTMRLHPFEAPTNAFRFARLARAGAFDGLTFHRVAPFFVVQGPGPFANEYSAPDKPFARDELALSNVRGSVGLSTRGRDTGDGQIYVNTVDNVWLDHDYTVMGTITSGLDAFDRMQEGARIRRVTIVP
ncbi:MAG TPA: peptidylprolyl isomerase [Gemmatimonadaceae bacterium]|nr:peptidylprolyl isomerase [Gemmatimonadaceae bacterium]